jgi:hypothetical protein
MNNDISKLKKLIESAHAALFESGYDDSVKKTAELVLKAIKSPIRVAHLKEMIRGYGESQDLEGNSPDKFVEDVVSYLHSHFKNQYQELPESQP